MEACKFKVGREKNGVKKRRARCVETFETRFCFVSGSGAIDETLITSYIAAARSNEICRSDAKIAAVCVIVCGVFCLHAAAAA